MLTEPQEIIDFWFDERAREHWWRRNLLFDQEIHRRFSAVHRLARAGQLAAWRSTPLGRLAEIIVLDQFSRNLFRESAEAFAQDELARKLTYEALEVNADRSLEPDKRSFLYMPLMHSESAADHAAAVRLFSSHEDLSHTLEFELKHKAIIDRFGRYPHRNAALGRPSTAEELEFLQQPGSAF